MRRFCDSFNRPWYYDSSAAYGHRGIRSLCNERIRSVIAFAVGVIVGAVVVIAIIVKMVRKSGESWW
ncbi:membrane protein [Streptomyces phage MulchMansion]|nr:membrane protein [Streptomyces phage MulchMansion]UVK61260.1 membrane protein [Streptomyces phage Angela]